MGGLYARLKESTWAKFVDDYRRGGGFEELQKLLHQNPKELYDFYGSPRNKPQVPVSGIEDFFSTAKTMFSSFLKRLNPARRVAYLFALGVFVWGLYGDEWSGAIVSFGVLTFLLAIELAEKLLTKDELEIARAIQFSLQPIESPQLDRLDVASHFQPAKDVGGDYYDYAIGSGCRFTVIMGDVSGKGMPAALYAMKLQALFALLGKRKQDPKTILVTMNDVLGPRLARSYFITAVVAVMDFETGTMDVARAGHNHPLHYQASTRRVHWLKPQGMGIGMKAAPVFDELLELQRVSLGESDVVLFYTDGVTEAMNAAGQTFGEKRLASIVAQHADETAGRIRAAVLAGLDAHRAGYSLADDMTFLVAKIRDRRQALEIS